MLQSFDGLLVIDKPSGITSRDAVDRAQRWFPRETRIGHTGTLDPLATGVLVLCLGNATRLTEYVQAMGKTYRTTIRLGARSDSDDADGHVTEVENAIAPSRKQIEDCLTSFIGNIAQVPPAYSAAKVTGRRAYALARSGEEVHLAPRTVRVDAINILKFAYPLLELEVRCGKGTYIRSLARDIGEQLGCGGYVEMLRRTRVGPFHAEDGLTLTTDATTARTRVLPLGMAMTDLPRLTVQDIQVLHLRQGKKLAVRDCVGNVGEATEAAAFNTAGDLVAVVSIDRTGLVRPLKVMAVTGRS